MTPGKGTIVGSSPRRTLFVLFSLVVALAALGTGVWHHKRYNHLEVHDPGMVYRSAWLKPDAFAELIEEHQIRSIVNLCNPDEMGHQRCVDQRAAVEGAGAILHDCTMPNTVDPSDPQVAKLVEILSNPANYPMLVHCQHGVTRTAKVLAMYDILYRNLGADESLDQMPLFGRKRYSVSVYAFARNFEQMHTQIFPETAGRLDALKR